jgi:Transposase IS66 family
LVHLLNQYRPRKDEAGTLARTVERELGALWTFVVEAGVEPTTNRAERALRCAVLVEAVTCAFNRQHPDVSGI